MQPGSSLWSHHAPQPEREFFHQRWGHILYIEKDRREGEDRRFCLGEEFIQFLATLAILPRTILKNGRNSSFSFKSSWRNKSYSLNRPVQNI